MSIEKKASKEEIMTTFYSHWQNLPIYRELDPTKFKKLSQPIRHKIIAILSTGISDINPSTNENAKRHVLSAREIMDQLKSKFELEVKKSNLYFHIQQLEDEGIIEMVDQIPTGKRFTTYYSRTAKVFYPKNQEEDIREKVQEHSPLRQPEIKELIKRMNPDLSIEDIEKTMSEAEGINNFDQDLFRRWVNRNQQYTEGLDINFISFHNFISILNRYDMKTIKGLTKLAKYLKVDELRDKK